LAMGILVAIKRGLSKALTRIEELLVIGLQHINTPTITIYRTIWGSDSLRISKEHKGSG